MSASKQHVHWDIYLGGHSATLYHVVSVYTYHVKIAEAVTVDVGHYTLCSGFCNV